MTAALSLARRFLRDLERAAPMRITRVLTDNGKAFTDWLFGLRCRAATGNHDVDRLCADLGIEHRLSDLLNTVFDVAGRYWNV